MTLCGITSFVSDLTDKLAVWQELDIFWRFLLSTNQSLKDERLLSVPQGVAALNKSDVKEDFSQGHSSLTNFAILMASLIVVLAGIHATRTILAPIFMATFFAVLLLPPLRWLRQKGFSHGISLVVVSCTVAIIGLLTVTVIGSQLTQFAQNLPVYRNQFNEKLMNYNLDLGDFFPFLKIDIDAEQRNNMVNETGGSNERTIAPPSSLPKNEKEINAKELPNRGFFDHQHSDTILGVEGTIPHANATESSGESSEGNDSGTWVRASGEAVRASSQELFKFIAGLTSELSLVASSAFMIMLLVIFMLLEGSKLPDKIAEAFDNRDITNDHLKKITTEIRRYMVIKTGVSILVGVFTLILLVITKVQYPFLWAFVAFLLNFIPTIGSPVAAIPPIILGTTEHGLVTGAILLAGFVLINCSIGYLLEPNLLGDGLDLSPLVVLISLIFCGWLLGAIGMFLSPPLAVILKIIFSSFPETRWISTLMSNKASKDKPPGEILP